MPLSASPASGGAPFVVAAIERARAIGAYTVALVSVEGSPLARAAEIAIVLATGTEALAGSTRLKAGTAQKIALNALSTAVMVRLGKVHGNLMVDVIASNRKVARARAAIGMRAIAGVDDDARPRATRARGRSREGCGGHGTARSGCLGCASAARARAGIAAFVAVIGTYSAFCSRRSRSFRWTIAPLPRSCR